MVRKLVFIDACGKLLWSLIALVSGLVVHLIALVSTYGFSYKHW